MSSPRVIVVHGYGAAPTSHWFGWLRDELARAGVDVAIPEMPDTDAPNRTAWVRAVGTAVRRPDERTALVTHSLGTITALHALDQLPGPWRLGALVAVSGFVSALPEVPEVDEFTKPAPDVIRTVARTSHRLVVHSDNDEVVPPERSEHLAGVLDAERVVVPGAGHFLDREGYTELPVVADFLRRWLARQDCVDSAQ